MVFGAPDGILAKTMASHIRELLASAQAAEIRGDKSKAARLLKEAAAFYRDRKNAGRALQMLRHARRLEGLDPDAFDESPGLLSLGEVSVGVMGHGASGQGLLLGMLDAAGELGEPEEEDETQALEALGFGAARDASSERPAVPDATGDPSIGVGAELPEVAQRPPLAEREVTLADPTAELWCSFCCRPQAEAGRLVGGPTGSFICASCVQKSLALLLSP